MPDSRAEALRAFVSMDASAHQVVCHNPLYGSQGVVPRRGEHPDDCWCWTEPLILRRRGAREWTVT